jgi:Nif11 domain
MKSEIEFTWRLEREGNFMTMKSVVDFFAVVKEDKSLQRRTQLATDINTIIKIAEEYDYKFTNTELQSFLGKIPNQDLASAVNPGIGNRLHISPR